MIPIRPSHALSLALLVGAVAPAAGQEPPRPEREPRPRSRPAAEAHVTFHVLGMKKTRSGAT